VVDHTPFQWAVIRAIQWEIDRPLPSTATKAEVQEREVARFLLNNYKTYGLVSTAETVRMMKRWSERTERMAE